MLAAEGCRGRVRHHRRLLLRALLPSLRDHGIRLITPRHETTAVHMAGAYARLTGRLGVCIASNGPGVANALPGVAVENGEGNRVLAAHELAALPHRRRPIAAAPTSTSTRWRSRDR